MDGTGLQRFRAFQAFSWGLFCFATSFAFEMLTKTPEILRLPFLALACGILYFLKTEYDAIMAAAAPMFKPKPEPEQAKPEIFDSVLETEECFLDEYDPLTGECNTNEGKSTTLRSKE